MGNNVTWEVPCPNIPVFNFKLRVWTDPTISLSSSQYRVQAQLRQRVCVRMQGPTAASDTRTLMSHETTARRFYYRNFDCRRRAEPIWRYRRPFRVAPLLCERKSYRVQRVRGEKTWREYSISSSRCINNGMTEYPLWQRIAGRRQATKTPNLGSSTFVGVPVDHN